MNNTIKKSIVSVFALIGLVLATPVAMAAGVPTMSTNSATNITTTSATLNGYFNDNGSPMTSIFFQYGDSPILENNSNTATILGTFGNYSVNVSGLTSGTTYYFQAVGINGMGFGFASSKGTFTTGSVGVPVVSTNSATNITTTSAVLNGYYNGSNLATSTYFEYGTSSSNLSSQTPTVSQSGNFGSFSASLTGLASNTTYYFRAVAVNSQGTTRASSILNFTTSGTSSSSCYISSFSSNDYSVNQGDTVTLSWVTSNCNSTSITNLGSVTPVASGSINVSVYSTTSYTLNASGDTGSDSENLTVAVNGNRPNDPRYGCSTWTGCLPGNDYNGPQTYDWGSWYSSNYAQPQYQYTYQYQPTPVYYYPNSQQVVVQNQPKAVTTNVTQLDDTSASLHGTAYAVNVSPTYAWFEYGPTTSLGKTTNKLSVTGLSSGFESGISNLIPETTYYFRLVVENQNGISKGDIMYFTTLKQGSVKTSENIVVRKVATKTTPANPTVAKTVSEADTIPQDTEPIDGSNLGAAAAFGAGTMLPHTALGWLLLIIFLFLIALIARAVFAKASSDSHPHGH